MEFTHLHLVLVHLPIYGSILGVVVLAYGIITESNQTKMASYLVLLIAAVGGILAFFTGEPAEETAKVIQGIDKDLIEAHEEFAKITVATIVALALASLSGIYITHKRLKFAKSISIITLNIGLACFAMTAITGYLGGKIRHTETSTALTNASFSKIFLPS